MANFNEHALEMSIMELFKDEGYTYVSGDQIHRERTEVLLTDDMKQYLYNRYAKDGITPSEVDSVILMLRNISGTIYAFNFKLINHFENIVFGSVEINKFNIEVFLRSILTIKNKSIAEQLKYSFVCFINRTGNITQH